MFLNCIIEEFLTVFVFRDSMKNNSEFFRALAVWHTTIIYHFPMVLTTIFKKVKFKYQFILNSLNFISLCTTLICCCLSFTSDGSIPKISIPIRSRALNIDPGPIPSLGPSLQFDPGPIPIRSPIPTHAQAFIPMASLIFIGLMLIFYREFSVSISPKL